MKKFDTIIVKYNNQVVGTLSMTPDNRLCAFEYSDDWIANGFSVSPLDLPLKKGIFIAKPTPFNGNFGVFEDSLPDGYGRYLLHKTLLLEGVDDSNLTSLDRLSIVGESGMGALTYHPFQSIVVGHAITDFEMLQQKALEVLREHQGVDAEMLLYNSGNSGGARPKAIFSDDSGHWLVKFRHTYDSVNIGVEEFRYNELARKCGIVVPDFTLFNGKYFASRRFDLTDDGRRRHVVTAGGLLNVSLMTPVLDYSNLLALTGFLTQDKAAVEQMFLRMVFNYRIDNKDDHCKNFSFMVDESEGGYKWLLAPAYDLTHSPGGYNGQHATSVNGSGSPADSDFVAVGTAAKLSADRCRQLISQIDSVIDYGA